VVDNHSGQWKSIHLSLLLILYLDVYKLHESNMNEDSKISIENYRSQNLNGIDKCVMLRMYDTAEQ
jgi:hypothetical protein